MKVLNRDVIKLIALILMLGNHIAYIFLPPGSFKAALLIDLGCSTAPIMCCFLVEGFYKTRSRRKYGQRLAAFALLSQLPFYLAFYPAHIKLYNVNMMGTLFLCFMMLCVLESSWEERSRKMAIFLLFMAGCFCDWPVLAQIFVLIFWRLHRVQEEGVAGRRDEVVSWFAVIGTYGMMEALNALSEGAGTGQVLRSLDSMAGPVLAAILILFFYNGKKARTGGEFLKWFCYVFYPGHLLVLGLVRLLLR